MNRSKHKTSSRLSRILFSVLVLAFLTMQWSTAHIHLAEHHDHDGSHHQHDITAHAHQLINLHDDTIGSNHQFDDINIDIVELVYDCNPQTSKKSDDSSIVSNASISLLTFCSQNKSIVITEFKFSQHRYLDYSTINLRAPPQFS